METLLSPVKSVFVNIYQLHCSTERFMFAPPPSPHRDPIRCISKLYSNSKLSASSHLYVQHCCKVKCIQLSAKGDFLPWQPRLQSVWRVSVHMCNQETVILNEEWVLAWWAFAWCKCLTRHLKSMICVQSWSWGVLWATLGMCVEAACFFFCFFLFLFFCFVCFVCLFVPLLFCSLLYHIHRLQFI